MDELTRAVEPFLPGGGGHLPGGGGFPNEIASASLAINEIHPQDEEEVIEPSDIYNYNVLKEPTIEEVKDHLNLDKRLRQEMRILMSLWK